MNVMVRRIDGLTVQVPFTPEQLTSTVVIVDVGAETLYLVPDGQGWREMTEDELAQERRANDADMRDMEQIRQEWRAYRDG